MAIGTGLPIPALLGGLGNGNSNNLLGRARELLDNSGNSASNLNDQIDLSDDSRAVLSTIREGLQSARRQDLEFRANQLAELREQISFVNSALAEAGPEQQEALLRQVNEIAVRLGSVGADISNLAFSSNRVEAQSVTGSFSSTFNAIATSSNGTTVSVAEELNVEFSFQRVSTSQQVVQISQDGNGLTVEAATQQAEAIAVQISVEREQSVVVETGGPGANFESLIDDFRNTFRDFSNLVADIQEQFGIKELPEPFIELIKGLASSDLDGAIEGPIVIDAEA